MPLSIPSFRRRSGRQVAGTRRAEKFTKDLMQSPCHIAMGVGFQRLSAMQLRPVKPIADRSSKD
jgi:hypothetical protein